MKKEEKPLLVRLTKSMHRELKILSAKTDVSMSKIVGKAVEKYLEDVKEEGADA